MAVFHAGREGHDWASGMQLLTSPDRFVGPSVFKVDLMKSYFITVGMGLENEWLHIRL